MNDGFAVRPAKAGEEAAIGALINTIQRREFGIPITLEDQPDLADIDGFYRQGAGDFWVATHGECIVGTIALIDIGDGMGALRKMFVHEDYRGRKKGVAGDLLDVLLGHAKVRGFSEIFLGTTAAFGAAHRFYEKNGFSLIAAEDLPKGFPRMDVDTRFYRFDI